MDSDSRDIAERLAEVRGRLREAALRSSRSTEAVRLLAVSKTVGLEHIRAAVEAGQRDFGESRVQEGLQKMERSADLQITWHLIGTLQSNKARKAAAGFAWIHSVDSLDVLKRIDTAAAESGTEPKLLVQVDLAGEATKHGASPSLARDVIRAGASCKIARVVGLMTIPPFFDDPERARPYFIRLRELRDTLLNEGIEPALLSELSMGMSHDFEIAVQEGATIVRIGTAIFGRRHV